MNFSFGIDDALPFGAEDDADRRPAARQSAKAELDAMSAAMVAEEGLLNHAQAGLVLDVSTKRVSELVRLGKLTRFDFLGRTYVSMKEVKVRRDADLRAGRPVRNLVERVVTGVKAAAKTDLNQWKLGGFAGPYEKDKAKRKGGKK